MHQKKSFSKYIQYGVLWGILLLIIGMLFYNYISKILIDSYKNNIADYAMHTSKMIEEKLASNLNILESISSSSYIGNPDRSTEEKLDFLRREAVRNAYKRLGIVDIYGNLKSTDKKEANISDRDYFKKAVAGERNVSDPLTSRLDGTMVITLAVPIKNGSTVSGVLYASIEVEELCKIIEGFSHGSNFSAFILNGKGTYIADKNRDLVYSSENLLLNTSGNPNNLKLVSYLKQITERKTNTGLCFYKGAQSFIAFTPIEGTDWSAVVTIPKSQALKTSNFFLTTIMTFFFIIALFFVAVYIYNKYLRLKLAMETSTVNKVTGAANVIIIHLDLLGKIIFFNEYAEEKTMYQKEETINIKTIFDISDENDGVKIKSMLSDILEKKSINGFEFSIKDKQGNKKTAIWNIDSCGNLYNDNFDTIELIGIDITERVKAEYKLLESYEVIKTLAYNDPLTGLSNRYILYEKAQKAVEEAVKKNTTGALILIDLDNFKNINDSYGHSFGDMLLKEIGKRLDSSAKAFNNTAFRLGGDEFIVLIENLENRDQCTEYLNKIIDSFSLPIRVGNRYIHVTSSIGISLFPDDSSNVEDLMKNSDCAMYYAKNKRKRKYMYYDSSMNAEIVEKMDLEEKLRKAIRNNEFSLYYQPQIDLKTGKIRGFEALIRWESPDYGMVQPLKFISIAEETGLIIPIGMWVLDTACRFSKFLLDEGYGRYSISVNISIIQLIQDDFVDIVKKVLNDTGLNPELLELEITESILMESIDQCHEKLEQLKKMGMKLSLDDFGKGYSSFSYLKELPVNILKIDKSFIDDIGKNINLTESIVHLGHKMGLGIIAEGVEYGNQLDYLMKTDCDIVQGYLFSKPLPEKEAIEILKSFE